MRHRLVPIVLGCAVCAQTTPLVADEAYREALTLAVAAKERALDSQQEADWSMALEQFRRAYRIEPTASAAYEIGVVALELGQEDLAVESFELALRLGLTGSARQKADQFVATNAPRMARLQVQGRPGTQLFLRNFARGQLPLDTPLVVRAGPNAIQVRSTSGIQTDLHVNPTEGQLVVLNLDSIGKAVAEADPSSDTRVEPRPPSSNQATSSPRQALIPRLAPTPEVKAPSPGNQKLAQRRVGWLLVGAGASFGLLSGGFMPIVRKHIEGSRLALKNACDVQTRGPDSCDFSKWGQMNNGQAASDSIATWKAVRTACWVGLGTGLTAAAAGISLLLFESDRSRQRGAATQSISIQFAVPNLVVSGAF